MEVAGLTKEKIFGIVIHTIAWGLLFCSPFLFAYGDNASVSLERYVGFVIMPLTFMTVFYGNYGILTPRLLFRKRLGRFILANLLLIAAVLLIQHIWHEMCHLYIETEPPRENRGDPPPVYFFIAWNAMLMALTVGLAVAIRMTGNWYRIEAEKQQIEKERTQAELKNLKSQLNPHFLFNTLNTIASFTRTDPLRARELLREFSSFYRATLDNSGSLIPVSREVAQTKRYLTFEKARFGEDRVLATFDVSEDVEDTLVPAFVIQPIVENAVRHGMGDDDALRIDVTVHQDGEDAILIAVADNGVGMDEGTAARLFDERSARPDASSPQGGGAGVAMHNISERIHRFYGPHSYTRVESAPGKGTKVLLHLDLSESIFDIQE